MPSLAGSVAISQLVGIDRSNSRITLGSNNCHRTSRGWSALEDDFRTFPCARDAASPKIDIPKFKDATGISGKDAIPLLQWLDRETRDRGASATRESSSSTCNRPCCPARQRSATYPRASTRYRSRPGTASHPDAFYLCRWRARCRK